MTVEVAAQIVVHGEKQEECGYTCKGHPHTGYCGIYGGRLKLCVPKDWFFRCRKCLAGERRINKLVEAAEVSKVRKEKPKGLSESWE